MEISLTHKVDAIKKLYKCESRTEHDGKVITVSGLILAMNSDEATAKLREYMFQERPSLDQSKTAFLTLPEYVID